MTGDPEPAGVAARKPRSNLQIRVISGIFLAAIVFALSWFGGASFRLLAVVIGAAVYFEWQSIVTQNAPAWLRGLCALMIAACLAVVLAGMPAGWMLGSVALAVVAAAIAGLAAGQGLMLAAGIAYSGLPTAALALLRGDTTEGVVAVIFLFATVWATDIFAYFVGRRVGGPKLAPRISPNKTWSGAIGGALAATLAGAIVATMSKAGAGPAVLMALALVISVVAQIGDLFESAVKRRFGVKDSGQMIPGHGGMMDRVDGLVAAALALYVIGVATGNSGGAAEALFGG